MSSAPTDARGVGVTAARRRPLHLAALVADLIASQPNPGDGSRPVSTLVIEAHRDEIITLLWPTVAELLALREEHAVRLVPAMLVIRSDIRSACGGALAETFELMLLRNLVRGGQRQALLVASAMVQPDYADPLLDAALLLHGDAVADRIAHIDGATP